MVATFAGYIQMLQALTKKFTEGIYLDVKHFNLDYKLRTKTKLRICHISDLHFSSRNEKIPSWILDAVQEKIQKLNPDYLFVTGDLIDCKDSSVSGVCWWLSELYSPNLKFKFVIAGNHDSSALFKLQKECRKHSLVYLHNEKYNFDSLPFNIIGLSDIFESRPIDYKTVFYRLLDQQAYHKPSLILVHNPYAIPLLKYILNDMIDEYGWKLPGAPVRFAAFCGHTHAYQIVYPKTWLRFLKTFSSFNIEKFSAPSRETGIRQEIESLVPDYYFTEKYIKGKYSEELRESKKHRPKNQLDIFVNPGLASHPPGRFLQPPSLYVYNIK